MRTLPLLLLLAACAPVTRIGDKIVGLTNPVLVGGIVLGTRPPQDDALRGALELAGVTGFTEVRLVVADALELQDIDQALVTDAGVTLETPEPFAMSPEPDGWYRIGAAGAPSYAVGGTWRISADLPDRVLPGTVDVDLPDVAELDFDPERDPSEDFTLDLSGQGFDYAFAAVYDLEGEERFTTAPTTNEEIVDLVLPAGDPVEQVTIPGETFDAEGVYVVGLAGLQRAPAERVDGLNEALTAVLAGRVELFPVVVGSRIGATALFLGTEVPDPTAAALLAQAGVDTDAIVEVFVADLLAAGGGVAGANVQLGTEPVDDLGEGRYRLEDAPYVPGQQASLRVATDLSAPGVLRPTLPEPVQPGLPATSVFGQGVTATLPGGPYRIGLGVVVGPDGVTWSNVPESPETWRIVLDTEGAVESVRIPPTAFPEPGVYAVGVAAVAEPPTERIDLNAGFSLALAGSMVFDTLIVTP